MIRCFWLLNHEITDGQKVELRNDYGVGQILVPPVAVSEKWANIPPVRTIPEKTVSAILEWLDLANPPDIAVVQGEATISFQVVNYLINRGIIVLASVSDRCSDEKIVDGKIVKNSVFKHVCFRKYVQ